MRSRLLIWSVLAAFLLSGSGLGAATIHFENGDRLTGVLIEMKRGKLILETPIAGKVVLDWSAVVDLSCHEKIVVHLGSGEVLTGTIQSFGDGWMGVTTRDGTITIAKDMVEAITRPVPAVSWMGGVGAGSSTSGDSAGVGAEFWLVRTTERDRQSLSLTGSWGEDAEERDSDYQILDLRWDRQFTGFYLLGLARFESDSLEALDLRSTLAPGIGRTLFDDERFRLFAEAGPALTVIALETGTDESDFEARLAVGAEAELPRDSRLTGRLELYPNLSRTGEYRFEAGVGYDARLSSSWSVRVAVDTQTRSDAPVGIDRTDVRGTAGIAYRF